MDELSAVLKAREFAQKANPVSVPVSVDTYAARKNAVIKKDSDLKPDQAGYSFERNGQCYIGVNESDSYERRRFTVCHELAHIVLGLPSEHEGLPSWSYAKRSQNEILCDVFASELLLPSHLFKPLAEREDICFSTIYDLAGRFEASIMATGSRLATVVKAPCAFVLSESRRVRYASRSTALRQANAWISPGMELPSESVSAWVRGGNKCEEPAEIDADIWFNDWKRIGTLLEEARYLPNWDQTLTLLWFEDEELPPARDREIREVEEEVGLEELSGVLPWPGKSRRKK